MTGKAYLIGAGPGDPELMTLKAARALGRQGGGDPFVFRAGMDAKEISFERRAA